MNRIFNFQFSIYNQDSMKQGFKGECPPQLHSEFISSSLFKNWHNENLMKIGNYKLEITLGVAL